MEDLVSKCALCPYVPPCRRNYTPYFDSKSSRSLVVRECHLVNGFILVAVANYLIFVSKWMLMEYECAAGVELSEVWRRI